MKTNNHNDGIRMYFAIPCTFVIKFLKGEEVLVWPTPTSNCPSLRKGTTTLLKINPDEVEIKGFLDDAFTIQRKDIAGDPSTSVKAAIKGGPSGIAP